MLYCFADCTLDTGRYLLHRAGQVIELRPKIFQVLTYLLSHRDKIVSKQELAEQLWPDQLVSDAAIEVCIKRLRQALGDSGRTQRVIQTRRGHGYQFIAETTLSTDACPGNPAVDAPAPSPTRPDSPPEMAERIGEWKIVTALSCTLAVPSVPCGRTGFESWHRGMQTLHEHVRRVISRYSGNLQPVTGDRITAVFGAPVSQEDHAIRAVLAALELRQNLAAGSASPDRERCEPPALLVPLAVRMGVHSGPVAVEAWADSRADTAAVFGDVTTRAGVLQEAAAEGMILCSAATARLVQRMVRLKANPLSSAVASPEGEVYQLVGHRRQRIPGCAPGVRTDMPFTGRQLELTHLQALRQRAETGQGQAVVLVGEPGIGKSRLVHEFRRSLQGRPHTYIQGRCVAYGRSTPYLPILALLRHACAMTNTDRPAMIAAKLYQCLDTLEIAPELAAPYLLHLLLGSPAELEHFVALSPEVHQSRIFDTLLHMALAASHQQLLILEIEDLHWIDATSAAWLAMFVDRLAGVPILLLTTSRSGHHPPWLAKSYTTQLTLSHLTDDDSHKLVQSVLPIPQFPEPLVRQIVTKAGGNPLFLGELARAVLDDGHHQAQPAVPDTIQAVIAARIDQLPAATKNLLQMMSVMGTEMSLPLVQALSGHSEDVLKEQLQHLQASELLYESTPAPYAAYTFKHALIQDVAYQSLLIRTRQVYHERIAQLLVAHFPDVAERHPERVAHHYTEATLYEQSMAWWRQASRSAEEQWAFIEAGQHASTGLEILQRLPKTTANLKLELELLLILAPSLHRLKGGAAPEMGQAYARVLKLRRYMEEPSQLFFALHGLRRFHMIRGHRWTAQRLGKQLFRLAQHTDDTFFLQGACYSLGHCLYHFGEATNARPYLERGLTLVNPQLSTSFFYDLLCRSTMASMLWVLGYPDQARKYAHHVVTQARPLLHPFTAAQALFYTSWVYYSCGELPAARRQIEEMMDIATKWDLAMWLVSARGAYGEVLSALGQTEAAIDELQYSLSVCRTMGVKLYAPGFMVPLATAYGKLGKTKDGLRATSEGLAMVDNMGGYWLASELHRVQGELLLAQADYRLPCPEAEMCFEQALSIARGQRAKSLELRAALSLSRLWQRQGRCADAHQLLMDIYSWFTEGFDTADLLDAKALLHDLAE